MPQTTTKHIVEINNATAKIFITRGNPRAKGLIIGTISFYQAESTEIANLVTEVEFFDDPATDAEIINALLAIADTHF